MDWTGGTRRRFANRSRRDTLIQKQKAYFAKVRGGVHSSQVSQPYFNPDYLLRARIGGMRDRGDGPEHQPSRFANEAVHLHRQYASVRPRRKLSQPPNSQLRSGDRSSDRRQPHSSEPRHVNPSGTGSRNRHPAGTRSCSRSSLPAFSGTAKTKLTEEGLILAKRQRLLARSDWMGLSLTKPIRMTFPVNRDKERIGRRRKVDKHVPAHCPAARRPLPPLFDAHLSIHEPMMRGALPPDESIRIRVGDDALASQTHLSTHQSVRGPSSETGRLSEESMLLGADGDIFEAGMFAGIGTRPQISSLESHRQSLVTNADCQMAGSVQHSLVEDPYDSNRNDMDQAVFAEAQMDEVPDSDPDNFAVPADRPPSERVQREVFTSHGHVADPRLTSTVLQSAGHVEDDPHTIPYRPIREAHDDNGPQFHALKTQTAMHETQRQDEGNWRRFFDVDGYTSNNHSMAALRSSSQHLTTSSDRWQRRRAASQQDKLDEPAVSTPVGYGTQQANRREQMTEDANSTELPSPSASLQQIIELSEIRVPQPANPAEQESESDVLWRKLVFGSRGRLDSSQSLEDLLQRQTEEESLPPYSMQSENEARKTRPSSKAMPGLSKILEPSASSQIEDLLCERELELSSSPVRGRRYWSTSKARCQVSPPPQTTSGTSTSIRAEAGDRTENDLIEFTDDNIPLAESQTERSIRIVKVMDDNSLGFSRGKTSEAPRQKPPTYKSEAARKLSRKPSRTQP